MDAQLELVFYPSTLDLGQTLSFKNSGSSQSACFLRFCSLSRGFGLPGFHMKPFEYQVTHYREIGAITNVANLALLAITVLTTQLPLLRCQNKISTHPLSASPEIVSSQHSCEHNSPVWFPTVLCLWTSTRLGMNS